jgi:hypothetical protein
MSAAAVATKTPAATAMAGAKTNNNQLKAACRPGHAAAKLLPPSCHRRCQAAPHRRATAAVAALPLPPLRLRCHRCAAAALPKALLPTLKLRFPQAAASAAALPPPPPPPCRRAARLCRAFAAAGPLPLPTLHCHQQCCRLHFNSSSAMDSRDHPLNSLTAMGAHECPLLN